MPTDSTLTLLKVENCHFLEKFQNTLAEDPLKARIFALSEPIYSIETQLWVQSEHKFQIVTRRVKYGVSVSLKPYLSFKKEQVVAVNNGKFSLLLGARVRAISIRTLLESEVWKALTEKYSWIRMLKEYNFPIIFNSVVRHRLYDTRKCYRYLYKCNPDKAKMIHDLVISGMIYPPIWKEITKAMINLDNLNPDLLKDYGILKDACSMAHKLCKKVNMSWSSSRLTQEHDAWSKYVTEVVYELSNRELNINRIFHKLNERLSGLLKTTRELAMEGQKQKHCVATYATSVDTGRCAIWHIEGYTAEIACDSMGRLSLKQFLGYRNAKAPHALVKAVNDTLEAFNEEMGNKYTVPSIFKHDEMANVPF